MISVLCIVLVVLSSFGRGDRHCENAYDLILERDRFSCCDLGDFFRTSADDSFHCGDTDRKLYLLIFYQNEVNDKTRVAFIAVIVIAAVMLALIAVFVYGGHLQGMSFVGENKIRQSNGYSGDIGVDMFAIAILVMLWTLVGAIDDTAMAIVSGVYEIARHNPEYEQRELILSGMKIGGSILSSTVNTLFFIFAGEYLILFINFSMYYSLEVMINSREFAEGIINIIISAVGCIAIIPAASCLAAYRFSKKII